MECQLCFLMRMFAVWSAACVLDPTLAVSTYKLNDTAVSPPRPSCPKSAVLGFASASPFTYHHGIGDTWPCASAAKTYNTTSGLICVAGDVFTGNGFKNSTESRSGMSVWRVVGAPRQSGYSGGFNMEMLSSLDVFDVGALCPQPNRTKWDDHDSPFYADTPSNTKPSTVRLFNGVLYLGVSCMEYGQQSSDAFQRQTNLYAHIAKSLDGGSTWAVLPNASTVLQGPLSAPMFIQGDYTYPHPSTPRGTAEPSPYIFAYFFYGKAENQSFWNNNDAMILGRTTGPGLEQSQWMFFCGSMATERWCPDFSNAVDIFSYPKMLGENMVTFDSESNRFIFANYGFYRGDTGVPYSWFSPPVEQRRWSQLTVFESPNLWGPYSLVHLEDNWRDVNAGYTPTFPAGWIHSEPTRHNIIFQMVHSGFWDDYNFAVQQYTFNVATELPSGK